MNLTLEQQLTNLELSKKMRELGFPQESLFYWGIWNEGEPTLVTDSWALDERRQANYNYFFYSAYTVAELGEFLKPWIKRGAGGNIPNELIPKDFENYIFSADHWAKLLIYLKEQGLI